MTQQQTHLREPCDDSWRDGAIGGRIAIANTRYTYRLGKRADRPFPSFGAGRCCGAGIRWGAAVEIAVRPDRCGAKMGGRANYVHLSQAGRNALDMHIALYLGRMLQSYPNARFHIISKDRGYEPLLSHINLCDRRASLWADLSKLPEPQKSSKNRAKQLRTRHKAMHRKETFWSQNQRPASIILKRSSQNSSTKTIRMLAL